MRDLEFIHATDDVRHILEFAAKNRLLIRDDAPTKEPKPRLINAENLGTRDSGSFVLYKPDWVFGELIFEMIPAGFNKGKYFQHPSTNYVGISIFFTGERRDNLVLRLGSGSISRKIDWYNPSNNTIQPAPPEVKAVFNVIRKHIDTGRRLRGGVHNYAVLEGAWTKLIEGVAMPPFDYIEWPPKEKAAEVG